jgi:hypothetical protein
MIVLFIFILQLFASFISFLVQSYTSPISDYTFTSDVEYLFFGMDERILKSKECAAEMTLQVHLTTIQYYFYNL